MDLKNLVVVKDGLKLGVEEGADLVSSDSSFEVDTNEEF